MSDYARTRCGDMGASGYVAKSEYGTPLKCPRCGRPIYNLGDGRYDCRNCCHIFNRTEVH